jgi:hypothetical protein
MLKAIAGAAAGLLGGYLLLGFLAPSWDHLHLFHPNRPVAANPATAPTVTLEPKVDDVPPPEERPNEPPAVTSLVVNSPPEQPPAPASPALTAEELARKAEVEKQDRLARLQTDRDAAIAAGEVATALKLTAEFAQLQELDPQKEQARVIDELRKVERSPAEAIILTGAIMEQARQALENEHKDLATEQATAALRLARKTTDQDLVLQATKLILEIQAHE